MPRRCVRRLWLWTICVITVVVSGIIVAGTAQAADAEWKKWEKIGPNWFKWVMPWGELLQRDTALNMSHLLNAPAGKHGFVRSVGNRFVFADGTRARFWGGFIGYQNCMPDPKYAPSIADWIAFNGWNCVREAFFQFIFSTENKTTTPAGDHSAPHPVQLDRFDRLNAELRKRGIYYLWNPFYNAFFNEKDGANKWSGRICFDETSFRLQERFLEQMLTHRNPYTGLRYVDDPALIGITLANESKFRISTEWESNFGPALWQELMVMWNKWLVDRYGNDVGLREAWADVQFDPGESLAAGTVRFPDPVQDAEFNSRVFDQQAFSGELELRYYRRLEKFMRELGLRVPVAATNWQHGYFPLKAAAQMGFSGAHIYHIHPSTWSPFTTGSWTHLSGAFADYRTERLIDEARTANVPIAVTEFNSAAPNDYRHEAVLSMAAHACLQDYDLVTWFMAFGWYKNFNDPHYRVIFDECFHTAFDPARIGLMPAASLMVMRGDVSPAANLVEILANDEVQRQLPDNVGMVGEVAFPKCYQLPGLEWVPFLTRQQINFSPEHPTPGAILVNPDPPLPISAKDNTIIQGPLDTIADQVRAELERRSPNFQLSGPGSGVSDTGELTYDQGAGVLVIDTPRTQALVGNLGSGRRKLSTVTFNFKNDAATVCVSSLDRHPLDRSRRMLVSCVADATNKDMDLRVPADTPAHGRPSRYLVKDWDWPTKRLMCEPVEGTLTIRLKDVPGSVRIYRLDAAGRRGRRVPCQIKGHLVTFSPSAAYRTLYYEILIS